MYWEKVFSSITDLIVIIKDGEGAKKFITIKVFGATTYENAKKVGFSIANSPLFKTAMAGSDSNWGRIIMAIGKSGVKINSKLISIRFGKFELIRNGEMKKNLKMNEIDEYLKGKEIELFVCIGRSKNSSTIWTCDFTNDYIKINTDYRS